MPAGLLILLRHRLLQPGLGELSDASKENAGGKGTPSKRKEVSPRQPSATGDGEVTEAALSAAGGGRPCCPPDPKVKKHAGTCKPLGKEVSPPPHLPPNRPPRHGESHAEHQGSSSCSLQTVAYVQMQPRVSGPGHALWSRRTSPEQGGQECLWHPTKQQSMEDLVSQVQLPSHRQLEARILNSSVHLILA